MGSPVGIVRFPGSNCEFDVAESIGFLGAESVYLWHQDDEIGDVGAVVVPGGFAHGDYLRPGAIARFSPIMGAVSAFAASGGPVVGICNGFQVLTEAGLLPGALQKNAGLKFRCESSEIRVETTNSPLTEQMTAGSLLNIPINHFEGNYTCSPEVLAELLANDQVVFRYVDNPNGSVDDIAGVCSVERNVVGLMPHPERACHPLLGSTDGVGLMRSLLAAAGWSDAPVSARRG